MVDSASAPDVPVDFQPPLSWCERGPCLIILRPSSYADCEQRNNSLDPQPLQKWAEESYAVIQVVLDSALSANKASVTELVRFGIDNLVMMFGEQNKNYNIGLLLYGSQKDYAPQFVEALENIATTCDEIKALVYFDAWDISSRKPALMHLPGARGDVGYRENLSVYSYPEVSSAGYIVPGHDHFKISSAGVAHTRSLSFLKKHLSGPYFDLEKIWEEHAFFEFGDRSVGKTMATMVKEPYVNHIPTITGGIGRAHLSKFYLNHFIFNNPDDTELELISRTVGTDRIVDEFIFCLTHNKEIDWLIPGIPPTGKALRIPMTAVVNIRGDRLYHEHIAWDQATILVQLGLLPEYLPYPYALPGGKLPAPGKRFEYRVPAAGAETAAKLKDEHAVPSNQMFVYKVREVDDSEHYPGP